MRTRESGLQPLTNSKPWQDKRLQLFLSKLLILQYSSYCIQILATEYVHIITLNELHVLPWWMSSSPEFNNAKFCARSFQGKRKGRRKVSIFFESTLMYSNTCIRRQKSKHDECTIDYNCHQWPSIVGYLL